MDKAKRYAKKFLIYVSQDTYIGMISLIIGVDRSQRRKKMSAFLGPIHYWMYHKIQLQQELIDGIIELGNKKEIGLSLEQELDDRYGKTEKRPLEEVIDQGNIHGWLQALVSQVEYKLAYGITLLLGKKPELIEELEDYFRRKGKGQGSELQGSSAAEVYKGLNDSLLDGMPCDHANSIEEEKEEELVWKRNVCVHQSYWEEAGGDIAQYYRFKEAFIDGYVAAAGWNFIKLDEVTYRIVRREQDE